MLGYLVIIVAMTVWYAICQQSSDEKIKRKNFLRGMTLVMTVLYGLRGIDTGSDTYAYIDMFLEAGSQPLSELWAYMWNEKSPAFVLCEWIFYKILPFPQLWLIATSAFFFIVFSKFIEKNSTDPYFSYYIFFTIFGTFQMTGVRQSCAMAVLLLAFEQMKNKKLVKYLLLIGLAYLFHKSSIVFLPFYFLGKRRITRADIPVVAVLLALIYQNRGFLFDYIKSFTSYDYFEQLNHGEPINFSMMIYASTLLAVLLCVLLRSAKKKAIFSGATLSYGDTKRFRLLKRELNADGELAVYTMYANAMILASLFMPLVAVNGAVRRIVMYFALFMVLFIPKAFQEFFEQRARTAFQLALMALLAYLLLRGIGNSSYAYTLFFLE